MKDYRNQIQQHLLVVRKMILEIEYYQNHRAKFEEDGSPGCILIAEANLKEAERLLEKL